MGPWKSGRVKKKSVEEGIKDSEEQSRGRKVKNDQQKGREEKKGGGKRGIGFGPPVSPLGAHFPPLCAWGLFLALEGWSNVVYKFPEQAR